MNFPDWISDNTSFFSEGHYQYFLAYDISEPGYETVNYDANHFLAVTAGLKSLNGQWITAYHLLSTGSIVAAIPPVIMFFLMQKHFIAGLTLGATKG